MNKKMILFVWMFLSGLVVGAQELTVTYRVTFNTQSPDLFAEAGLNEEMRSSLANAYRDVSFEYRLSYINGESEFRLIPSTEKQEITFMGQKIDVSASMAQQAANNVTYKNHTEGVVIDKVNVLGKSYLVTDDLKHGKTKFNVQGDDSRTILGFECKKAVSSDGKQTVWFTPHIPIGNEPVASGLPGLILALDNGQQIYTATQIEEKVGQQPARPSGSETMTKDDFDSMMKKRLERMKRGGGSM